VLSKSWRKIIAHLPVRRDPPALSSESDLLAIVW
jgi:hypothetical protein